MSVTGMGRADSAHGRRIALLGLVVLTLVGAGCVTVTSGDGGFLMGGRVVVEEGEIARNDIVMMGGSVRIDGEARRDIVVMAGTLTVNGTANGLVNIGGSMRIGPNARIRGDVVNVGGSMNRSPGADIDGEVVNIGIAGFDGLPWLGGWNGGWSFGRWWGISPFHVAARTTQFVYWLLLAVLTVALVGDRVSAASHAILREPVRLGAIGFVGFFALILLTVLFSILSVLLIGIPFLLATLLGWWLAYIFGIVAMFQVVGQRLLPVFGKKDASQLALVVAGGVMLGGLHYVPVIGTLTWWVCAFVGLGAVFATKFGTNRPWIGGRSIATAPPVPPTGAPVVEPPQTPLNDAPDQRD